MDIESMMPQGSPGHKNTNFFLFSHGGRHVILCTTMPTYQLVRNGHGWCWWMELPGLENLPHLYPQLGSYADERKLQDSIDGFNGTTDVDNMCCTNCRHMNRDRGCVWSQR
jgi:hypothetical protein